MLCYLDLLSVLYSARERTDACLFVVLPSSDLLGFGRLPAVVCGVPLAFLLGLDLSLAALLIASDSVVFRYGPDGMVMYILNPNQAIAMPDHARNLQLHCIFAA